MAKPKPAVPAKVRPVNLVLSCPSSARENPPQDLDFPVDVGMPTKDKVVKLVQGILYGPPRAQKSKVLK